MGLSKILFRCVSSGRFPEDLDYASGPAERHLPVHAVKASVAHSGDGVSA